MNTLQEASKFYKALKTGGPSFGAWQVHYNNSEVYDFLTELYR